MLSPIQSTARGRFLRVAKHETLLVGAAHRFADPEESTVIAWAGSPPAGPGFTDVHLAPTPAQAARGRLPSWLTELTALKSVTLPAGLVPALAEVGLLSRLEVVRPFYDNTPASVWPDVISDDLRAIELLLNFTQGGLGFHQLGLTPRHAPGLIHLGFEVGDAATGRALAERGPLWPETGLTFLELEEVRDAPVLGGLPMSLNHLRLQRVGPRAELSALRRLTALESLCLTGCRAPLDLELMTTLPALRELTLISTRRLSRIDVLLELKGLESLTVLDCGRPFDKAFKARLEARGFSHLGVAFA